MKIQKWFPVFLLVISSLAASAQQSTVRSGYFNNTKIGISKVLSREYGGTFISTVNGWHFNDNLSAGIGLAVQGYRDAPTFYPISVQGYYFIKESISTPYLYANAGYSTNFKELYKGSISYEVGIGWQFKVGGIALGPEVGFRRERWQARTADFSAGDIDNPVYTGYTGDFLRQINFGVSAFF